VTVKERPSTPPGKDKPGKDEDEAQWIVKFRDSSGDNLFTSNEDGSNSFTENEFVYVQMSGPSQQCACYGFHLLINRPLNQDSGSGPYAVGFRGISIYDRYLSGEGIPCVLPGLTEECFGYPCYNCIADFLTNNLHPSDGYLKTGIKVQLDAEYVDALPEGVRTAMPPGCGWLWISMYNGYPLIPEGCTEIYHEVYGFTSIVSDGLYITKSTQDVEKWIFEFVSHPLELKEQYKEECIVYRGKSEKIGEKTVTPQEVKTSPVSFEMTWEKLQ